MDIPDDDVLIKTVIETAGCTALLESVTPTEQTPTHPDVLLVQRPDEPIRAYAVLFAPTDDEGLFSVTLPDGVSFLAAQKIDAKAWARDAAWLRARNVRLGLCPPEAPAIDSRGGAAMAPSGIGWWWTSRTQQAIRYRPACR